MSWCAPCVARPLRASDSPRRKPAPCPPARRMPWSRAMRRLPLLLWLVASVCAADADAPYVMRTSDGDYQAWVVDTSSGHAQMRIDPLERRGSFTVSAVGEIPAFSVTLRKPADVAPDAVVTRKGAPLFVVADTHGEYEILAGMLARQHVVDAKLRWSFGRGHLVVL